MVTGMVGLHRAAHISRLQMERNWHIPAHSHDTHETVLILEGQIETRINGRSVVTGPGMVNFHPMGVDHEELLIGAPPLVLLCLGWVGAPEVPWQEWPLFSADRTGRMRMLMEWMLELSPPHDDASSSARDGLLQALVMAHAASSRNPADDLVLTIRSWVRAHLGRPIYLDDLARVAGVSRYHFNRIFRRAAGMPPMRFVREMRVDASRALLLNTTMPLREIAPQVGFTDEFQFSRVFREITGQSPASLRRRA